MYSSNYGEFTILQRKIEVKANDLEAVTYDGRIYNDYSDDNYSLIERDDLSSFVQGDNILVSAKFYLSSDKTNVQDNPKYANDYYIFLDSFTFGNESMDGNYDIRILDEAKDAAKFTINKRDVTIKAIDVSSSIYNGKIQDNYDPTSFTYDENSLALVTGDLVSISYDYFDEEIELAY